jgi:cell division GTPase FtsZ
LKDEVRVTVIATGFEEARQISNVQSVERRVNERVIPSAMSSGRRPMRGRELHSGIDRMHDDYDIPTFFKNAD